MSEKNTYGLPTGDRLRAELRRVFADQRRAVLAFLRTGDTKRDHWDSAGRPLGRRVRLVDGLGRGTQDRESKAGPADRGVPAAFPAWDDFGLGPLDIAARIVPKLALIWDAGLGEMMPRIGLDPASLSVESPELKEAIQAAALALSESTNETTSLELGEALKKTREALLAGNTGATQSYAELTKAINAIFDTASRSRARTIAVTESARAYHQAQEAAAEKSGTVTGWKWLLSSDACPLCQTIARRAPFVRLGQPFAVIGDNPTYSNIKFPPAHPRCQCSWVEVLDIDEQPAWSATLDQPVPEEEDIATQELIPVAGSRPRPRPLPRPKPLAPKKPPVPAIKERLDAWTEGDVRVKAIQALAEHLDDDKRAQRWIDAQMALDQYTASLKPGDKRKKAVREQLARLNAEHDEAHAWEFRREDKMRDEIARILKADKPLDFSVTSKVPAKGNLAKEITRGESWLLPMVNSGTAWGASLEYDSPPGLTRANAAGWSVHLATSDQARTVVHEIGHVLESQIKGVAQAGKDFLAYRLKGQENRNFREMFPDRGYDADEKGADDEFGKFFSAKGSMSKFGETSSWYVGKYYAHGSEVISMGLEALYVDGVRFAQKDPEYAKFIVGILSGDIR